MDPVLVLGRSRPLLPREGWCCLLFLALYPIVRRLLCRIPLFVSEEGLRQAPVMPVTVPPVAPFSAAHVDQGRLRPI